MGVTLRYRSADPVTPDVATEICGEVREAVRGARWIHLEPICLQVDEESGGLVGFSKLNIHPDPGDYAAAMKEPATAGDAERLVGALCDWSARFGITWELDIDGAPLGTIEGGRDDADIRGDLEGWAAIADEFAHFDPMTGEAVTDNAPAASMDELFADTPDDPDDPPPEGLQPHLFRPDGG